MVLVKPARILPTRNGNSLKRAIRRATGAKHGSYLQGMETRTAFLSTFTFPAGTDPTYKEWKHIEFQLNHQEWVEEHGSYLQGMETHLG